MEAKIQYKVLFGNFQEIKSQLRTCTFSFDLYVTTLNECLRKLRIRLQLLRLHKLAQKLNIGLRQHTNHKNLYNNLPSHPRVTNKTKSMIK